MPVENQSETAHEFSLVNEFLFSFVRWRSVVIDVHASSSGRFASLYIPSSSSLKACIWLCQYDGRNFQVYGPTSYIISFSAVASDRRLLTSSHCRFVFWSSTRALSKSKDFCKSCQFSSSLD